MNSSHAWDASAFFSAFACLQVFLDEWPASMNRLRMDDVVSSPSNNGNGFAFVNNTIGNLRGRGILCKSSNGVIAGNRMFNLKGFGIQMSPEHLWVESDFVNNVLVIDNTINSYGPGIWLGVDPSVRTQNPWGALLMNIYQGIYPQGCEFCSLIPAMHAVIRCPI